MAISTDVESDTNIGQKKLVQLRIPAVIFTMFFVGNRIISINLWIFRNVDENHQYIPFPIQDYLIQYFAYKLNSKVVQENGLTFVSLDRRSDLGKAVVSGLSVSNRYFKRNKNGGFFLRISNWIGQSYRNCPDATRNFLQLDPLVFKNLHALIRADFEDNLIHYVEGAEYAHLRNGWRPDQKKKGIRKHAILNFCEKYGVDGQKRTLETLFKLVQRHKNSRNKNNFRAYGEFAQTLSY